MLAIAYLLLHRGVGDGVSMAELHVFPSPPLHAQQKQDVFFFWYSNRLSVLPILLFSGLFLTRVVNLASFYSFFRLVQYHDLFFIYVYISTKLHTFYL